MGECCALDKRFTNAPADLVYMGQAVIKGAARYHSDTTKDGCGSKSGFKAKQRSERKGVGKTYSRTNHSAFHSAWESDHGVDVATMECVPDSVQRTRTVGLGWGFFGSRSGRRVGRGYLHRPILTGTPEF
jgi:hypothetical protein